MNRTVRDNAEASRYEIFEDGRLAGFTDYKITGKKIAFNHTETLDGFTGRGVAGHLIAEELADARRRNLAVLPFCPVVRGRIARQPEEHLDLVLIEDRQRFDLPA
ncbi:GNAT family N-acetyltransferase [Streptomyces rishiriensis]|uniref:GNAT family acetyltransferase n=1 Tax=Streptomyces rishiriensis TaxID=68264 RepID=A0ABU0NHV5_STRRH|nr:GNAT family N-acetyltransferase [Streptomyces rishiriensis]MDQ0578155.1 putative GNAT family acetyltransferase [Streptomyces rishiriensis]